MTIDKAIEILEDYYNRLPRGVNDDYVDAIKLGIEALKSIKATREAYNETIWPLLPGETQ